MKFLIPDFDIIANMPTLPHINHDLENIRETELLIDNMFEKLKEVIHEVRTHGVVRDGTAKSVLARMGEGGMFSRKSTYAINFFLRFVTKQK